MNFIEELTWRGMIHQTTPEIEQHLNEQPRVGYIGFDPTAPALTIGNYVQIMLLKLFQLSGHQPVVLMGGATGRIGDPSGKDKERELKTVEELDANLAAQQKVFAKFLDFEGPNKAIIVNNFDFYKDMNALDFLRDIGKNITVSVMMSRESVKKKESVLGCHSQSFPTKYCKAMIFTTFTKTIMLRYKWGALTNGVILPQELHL